MVSANKFKEGNQAAKVNRGKPQRKTLVITMLNKAIKRNKIRGLNSVSDLDPVILDVIVKGLSSRSIKISTATALQLLQYRLPKKKAVELELGDETKKVLIIERPMNWGRGKR